MNTIFPAIGFNYDQSIVKGFEEALNATDIYYHENKYCFTKATSQVIDKTISSMKYFITYIEIVPKNDFSNYIKDKEKRFPEIQNGIDYMENLLRVAFKVEKSMR
jgi:hypothetical protein